MNQTPHSPFTALQPFEPGTDYIYSIETVVHLTQAPRHRIAVYCRHGLVTPVAVPEREGWRFDDDAIREIRRLEHLRSAYGVNLAGARLMSVMLRELEELRSELRFLRTKGDNRKVLERFQKFYGRNWGGSG